MPGVALCGRCGARLELAATAIDVHPPRATPRAKRLRRWFPWYGIAARIRDGLEAIGRFTLRQLDVPQPLAGLFGRMVVPGWPQIFTGQIARGRMFLAMYLVLMAIGLAFVGTVFGSFALGFALAVHASSVIDVLWAATTDLRTRITYAAVCITVLGVVVYLPVGWAVTRFVVPRQLVRDSPPFAAGDAVLCNRVAYRRSGPAAGDVVLFRVVPRDVQMRTAQGGNAIYRVGGEFIDRVLAGPGQSVKWEAGSLWVDGQPSPWRPLNPDAVRVGLQWTVPTGAYLVLPSTQPPGAPAYPADVWATMSLVPHESLLGRVFLRHQPLWRWWWIR
jgi:type IV secretory pathway protease TraF